MYIFLMLLNLIYVSEPDNNCTRFSPDSCFINLADHISGHSSKKSASSVAKIATSRDACPTGWTRLGSVLTQGHQNVLLARFGILY